MGRVSGRKYATLPSSSSGSLGSFVNLLITLPLSMSNSALSAFNMQAAISRRRETLADVGACQLTRYPPGLIAALEKLKADTTVTHAASTATAHLWIEQPMSGVADTGRLGGIHRLFDTHPPLDERIALLREL